MNPIHFGASERLLFGVYHPPGRRPVRPDGVVLCYPLGLEYVRTHRTLRRLAEDLAAAGHHVLRFDYYGTGDSAGDGADADLEGWRSDVETAVEELRAIAGVSRVSLVGVRLGGALALLAAGGVAPVRSVALCDPVVRGASYLAELLRESRGPAAGPGTNGRQPDLEALGYPLPPALRRDLEGLDVYATSGPVPERVGLFLIDPDPATGELEGMLGRLGLDPARRELRDPGVWTDRKRFGGAVLASELVKEVAAWLS